MFIALYFKLNPQRCPSIMVARDLYWGWWLGPTEGGAHLFKKAASPEETVWSNCVTSVRLTSQMQSVLFSFMQSNQRLETFEMNELVTFNYQRRDHPSHGTAWSLLRSITSDGICLEKIKTLAESGSISAFNRFHLFIVCLMIDSGIFFSLEFN